MESLAVLVFDRFFENRCFFLKESKVTWQHDKKESIANNCKQKSPFMLWQRLINTWSYQLMIYWILCFKNRSIWTQAKVWFFPLIFFFQEKHRFYKNRSKQVQPLWHEHLYVFVHQEICLHGESVSYGDNHLPNKVCKICEISFMSFCN